MYIRKNKGGMKVCDMTFSLSNNPFVCVNSFMTSEPCRRNV